MQRHGLSRVLIPEIEGEKMKFKYALGERVLFKHTSKKLTESDQTVTQEMIGTITVIQTETTKKGMTTWYLINDLHSVSDSDILGTIKLQKASATRVRKKKSASIQTEISMANGADSHPV